MPRNSHETFERLKNLLAAESDALRSGSTTDLSANADGKARILLELTQLRHTDERATALTGDDAAVLAQMLQDNARLLERHMAAANRIASTLAQHLRDADSDGTYGAGHGQYSRKYSA